MTHKIKEHIRLGAGLLCALSLVGTADAQSFTSSKGDLLLGFRKTSGGSFELLVNIGNVTNFLALSPGTTIGISNYTPTQLSNAFSSYNNLQWSVGGAFAGSSAWAGFPASTLWTTSARASTNVQSTPPLRLAAGSQQLARNRIVGVGFGAATNSLNLGATTTNNNSVLVREPANDPNGLTVYIGDPSDSTYGDYQGTWNLVETVTPSSFTAAQKADLYQSVPDGALDPNSNQTTGPSYYIGYFQFNPDGTMTFTRATVTPSAPIISVKRNGSVTTVSFTSVNGATYTLLHTNTANLTAPRSTWTASSPNIIGDGSLKSFTDTNTASGQVYSVKVQ